MQQGVQTDATCNIQQCWELLVKNVASVSTQPNTHLLLLLQPLVVWLSVVTVNDANEPPPKWILREFTPPWNVYMGKFDPGWEGYPVWQTGLPALAGHPTKT